MIFHVAICDASEWRINMFSLKRMKFILYPLLSISIIMFVGCSSNKKINSQTKQQFKFIDNTHKLLVNSDWKYYDTVAEENLCITFCKNNEFYYNCECGEPVDDSDCYDKYEYKKGGKLKIYMSYEKNKDKKIKIIHIDDKSLLINLDGDVIEFYNAKNTDNCFSHSSMHGCEKCNKPLEKYDGFNTIVNMNKDNNEITIALGDYDKDDKQSLNNLRSVKLAEDVDIYDINIKSELDDNGNIKKHKCSNKKISKDVMKNMIDLSSPVALIWYDKDIKIKKIVFYGEVIIQ